LERGKLELRRFFGRYAEKVEVGLGPATLEPRRAAIKPPVSVSKKVWGLSRGNQLLGIRQGHDFFGLG